MVIHIEPFQGYCNSEKTLEGLNMNNRRLYLRIKLHHKRLYNLGLQ
jgi:hypothetical protein